MSNLYLQKDKLHYMEIKDIDIELPELKDIIEAKFLVIGKWMAKWIKEDLATGRIKDNYVLPSKSDFAYLLGVSLGTIQNAIRYIEDLGLVESKQCIGTIIKTGANKLKKMTTKRDVSVETIKSYIVSKGYNVGDALPATRTIASETKCSINTTRAALEYLATISVIKKSPAKRGWILTSLDFSTDTLKKSQTMVDLIAQRLEKYIEKNLKIGDKIPSHSILGKELKTSMRTVHEALNILKEKGIVLSKRGQYGTFVIKVPKNQTDTNSPKLEDTIFAPAKDTAFYHYEKIQSFIKRMIVNDYEIGDKLPSIAEVAKMLDVNNNTIRKAFHNLAKDGYLVFSRGRYGGTFVIDIPEIDQQSFKWLAVNPQYSKDISNFNLQN